MGILDTIAISVSIISFISTSICIAAHFILPKIRKNPGNLVLIQSFFQLYIDLTWIIFSGRQ